MGNKIREYETLFVLHPELADDAVKKVVERLKGVVGKMGGEVLGEDPWGKRKLAFMVKKQARGNYFNMHYVGPVGIAEELERTMRNLDEVIRFLTTGHGGVSDIEARKAEIEKAARESAQRALAAREERAAAEAHAAAE